MIHPPVLYPHVHPGYNDVVYHHIEQRQGHDYSLSFTPRGGEGRPVEAVCLGITCWHSQKDFKSPHI